MNPRELWNWLSPVLGAAVGLCIGWLAGWTVDRPPDWLPWIVGGAAGVLAILWSVGTYRMLRHRIQGARTKGGLILLEEAPLLPGDGSYGWKVMLTGGPEGLTCFRVVADESIGRAECKYQDSRNNRGDTYFALEPKRPNARVFCIPQEEPDIATVAEVRVYSSREIRVILIEPASEPPNLLEVVRRAHLNVRKGEVTPYSVERPVKRPPEGGRA